MEGERADPTAVGAVELALDALHEPGAVQQLEVRERRGGVRVGEQAVVPPPLQGNDGRVDVEPVTGGCPHRQVTADGAGVVVRLAGASRLVEGDG